MKHIYIDGSCMPNPGLGAAGYIIYDTKMEKIDEKVLIIQEKTTNNRAELQAFLLIDDKYLSESIIYSDSNYLVNGYYKWSKNWVYNQGQYYKKNKPIKNSDLWIKVLSKNNAQIKWVKAHDNNYGNNQIDRLIQNSNKKRIK